MRSEYTEIWNVAGEEILGQNKVVDLPFKRISARAIIIRRSDGSIVGTLHRRGGKYALPGGAPEDGESILEAVVRELEEENIKLINPEQPSDEDLAVDFFRGYAELSIWHFFVVEDAEIGQSEENVESRWVFQNEDVWYPGMRERLLLEIGKHHTGLARRELLVE
jgi:8-oxo-dGTP pyrophosphatase MutT (NUDIX family)